LEASAHALKEAVKAHNLIRQIADNTFSGRVYLVGGAIREILLEKTPSDYDLVLTDGNDLQVLERTFKRPSFVLGKKPIRTYRIVSDDASVDITFADGSIEDDLKRRDFTMNAIACDLKTCAVIDVVDGMGDIERKLIRYPAKESIADDPLRMLKAIRHFATLEGFALETGLVRSIGEMKHRILDAAAERIKYEMDRIIIASGVAEGLRMLDETGLLFEIFPELSALRRLDVEKQFLLETLGHTLDGFRFFHRYNADLHLTDETLRNVGYAFLFHDLGKAHTFSYDEQKNLVHFFYHERFSTEIATRIMERLRFSTHEIRTVLAIVEHHMRIFLISSDEPTEKALRRIVYKMADLTPSLILHTLCDMYGSSGGTDNPSTAQVKQCCEEVLRVYGKSLEEPLPRLLNGEDLKRLGFVQGPSIGRCLADIREKQITGEMEDRGQALMYAQTFLEAMQGAQ